MSQIVLPTAFGSARGFLVKRTMLAAALLVALIGCGTEDVTTFASSEDMSGEELRAVLEAAYPVWGTQTNTNQRAVDVCNSLDDGVSFDETVIVTVESVYGVTDSDVSGLMGYAVNRYCPQHRDAYADWLG